VFDCVEKCRLDDWVGVKHSSFTRLEQFEAGRMSVPRFSSYPHGCDAEVAIVPDSFAASSTRALALL
jgi:hypothetical protein